MTLSRVLWLTSVTLAAGTSSVRAQPHLTQYKSRHYVIHTDLDVNTAREAAIRLTKMFQEYKQRTSAFAATTNERLPFYMFSRHKDYMAAGGLPGSAGVFTGDKLMATMGATTGSFSWKLVQHEGFHQFVDRIIGRSLPVWVNEGMAEYFSEAVFTGDGFVAGLVPPGRLARIKAKITAGRFPPLSDMMKVNHSEWNQRMSTVDYDQAWSMVHFLAHGGGGDYEASFNGFLYDAGLTGVWDKAWLKHFGQVTDDFETAWRDYWLKLPRNPTADLYAEATVATLTGFLARAVSQKQKFASAEEFFEQAKAGKLRTHQDDWLPRSLLDSALGDANRLGEWSLVRGRRKSIELACVTDQGKKFVGRFTVRKGRVQGVSVEIDAE